MPIHKGRMDELTDLDTNSEAAMRALVSNVLKSSELLNNVARLYELAEPLEKEALIKKISSELLIDQNTAQLSPQIGLETVFRLKKLICEETDWFSELLKP